MPDHATLPDGDDRTRRRALARSSPMFEQYFEAKAAHPDCLLFFRMGDFYEMFFEDAEAASRALDITLTRRGQHDGEDIPMAGVPVHAHEAYLARLIRKGFRVAVCEQVETPEEARRRGGSKALVRRSVVRVVTPGTVTEDSLLEARAANYLAALGQAGGALALAHVDIATGALRVEPVEPDRLATVLARLEPSEVLVPEPALADPRIAAAVATLPGAATPLPAPRFDSDNGGDRLRRLFGVATLDAFGRFERAEISALGALVDYIDLTQQGRLPRLSPPRRLAGGTVMEIDAATRRNLELVRTLAGDRRGSLIAAIDRTATAAGARLLAEDLALPLLDADALRARLDAVARLRAEDGLRAELRDILAGHPDLERALSRLALGRGGPRDLAAVREAARTALALSARLGRAGAADPLPVLLAEAAEAIGDPGPLVALLDAALAAELPVLARDGGFVAAGYDEALDEQRRLKDDSRRLIAALQARYAAETGIASLKLRHNNVLGYFVEVTAAHAERLREGEGAARFIHRQTMAGAIRFTTTELADLDRRIAEAADRVLAAELEIFGRLAAEVLARQEALAALARAVARIDVAAGHAELAAERDWCRPEVDGSRDIEIEAGRHPVVEAAIAASDPGGFVANDCRLDESSRLWLLTGPNMAGKSTFLRQVALIAILAQIGAFVPAARARIGLVDRLFSRVGASDDLARGQSTFMVEMVETAAILNQATDRSLVILDEIGRGTATFDGLSIAWATVEHLHDATRARALFATHYHELTALAARLPGLSCHTMRVKEWQGDIAFLHEVAAGTSDRSYGLHVARLAGLPGPVVARAQSVLEALEREGKGRAVAELAEDLPLFTALREPRAAGFQRAPDPAPDPAARRLAEAVAALDLDRMTPLEALERLYALRREARGLGTAAASPPGRG